MARPLRAVVPGDPEVKRKSVADAAKTGDRLDLLLAMRDRIAEAISKDCHPRDLAPLTRRLQDIAKEIDQLELAGGTGSVVASTDDESFDATSI